jgi:hypothetical protein
MLVPPSVNSEVTINVGPSWRRRQGTSSTPYRKPNVNLCGPQRSRSGGSKWNFAAIAGAGPLVGPVLAAQMGYLPGTM